VNDTDRAWSALGGALATLTGGGIGALVGAAMTKRGHRSPIVDTTLIGAGLTAFVWGLATGSPKNEPQIQARFP